MDGHNILSVKHIQDEVRIEPLGIVGQDGEFEIVGQFPQPINKGLDAGGAFKMKQFVAVGSGSVHQVGHVNPRILHGFAVPVDEELVFLFFFFPFIYPFHNLGTKKYI